MRRMLLKKLSFSRRERPGFEEREAMLAIIHKIVFSR